MPADGRGPLNLAGLLLLMFSGVEKGFGYIVANTEDFISQPEQNKGGEARTEVKAVVQQASPASCKDIFLWNKYTETYPAPPSILMGVFKY